MSGLGTPELFAILLIAFLVFGGRRLPEIGEGLSSFKRALRDPEPAAGNEAQAPTPQHDA